MICWCSSTPHGCALLVFDGTCWLCFVGAHRRLYFFGVSKKLCFVGAYQCTLVVLCWCSSMPPCYALLVLVGCFILLVFICTSLVVLCWCSSTPPCCALLVLVGGFVLLVFIHLLDVLCWCSYAPSCCVLLILVDASLP